MINTTNLFARELVGPIPRTLSISRQSFRSREKLFGIDREKLTAPAEQAGTIKLTTLRTIRFFESARPGIRG